MKKSSTLRVSMIDYDNLVKSCTILSNRYNQISAELKSTQTTNNSLRCLIKKLQKKVSNPSIDMLDKLNMKDIEQYIRSKKLTKINEK